MLILKLMFEFFKIGLFAIGGGQATIPFLYDLTNRYDWFSGAELIDMIAISESTPGPIGVNMATYVGYNTAGIVGGILATLSLVFPCIVIIIVISKMLTQFRNNPYVDNVFKMLRPCVVGFLASSALTVFTISLFDFDLFKQTSNFIDVFKITEIILFIVLFILSNKYKKHPIFYLVIAMIIGITLQL